MKVTIFSLSFIHPSSRNQTRDGAASTHFNPVIKQEIGFNPSLKPNKKRVRLNPQNGSVFDPTHFVPKPNTLSQASGAGAGMACKGGRTVSVYTLYSFCISFFKLLRNIIFSISFL
jgi:hypothetical protein